MTFTLALLLLILVLCYTFQSLFTRFFSIHYAGKDATLSTSVFAICFGGLIGLTTLVSNGFSYRPSGLTLALGAINALTLWLYNIALIEAGNRGSYAFVIISNVFGGILVPLIVDVLFIGVQLSPLQLAAIALMLVSLVVMNAKGLSFKGASKGYYLWCALLFCANGLFSTLMNLQQRLMNSTQNSEMIVTSYLGAALIVVLFFTLRGQAKPLLEGFKMGRKSALSALGCGAVATLAANLMLYLLRHLSASILYTMDNGGVMVMSAICSVLFFREKLRSNQIAGIALATASIVMISL